MNELEFIKGAYKALIDRGIITEADLEPSSVTDEMLNDLEKELDVKLPTLLRTYLKMYSHHISMLMAAVPEDLYSKDTEIMGQPKNMTPEEIASMDEDKRTEIDAVWSVILRVPKEDPLRDIRNYIEGFRETIDYLEDKNISSEDIKRFIPIGEWMSAGPLCIDTSISDEVFDLQDSDTWKIRWFDHEEFDWKSAGYISENGQITGDILFPDFETFILIYFYGVYDKTYFAMLEEEEEEKPDMSTWKEIVYR